MKKTYLVVLILLTQPIISMNRITYCDDWGFFAHRLLNRLAVFTLPDKMIEFYKTNIAYLYEHAVDPDKRRYAIKGEAVRHYIDLDHWGKNAIEILPQNYEEAIIRTSGFYYINNRDTTLIFDTTINLDNKIYDIQYSETFKTKFTLFNSSIQIKDLSSWMRNHAMPVHDEKYWIISGSEISFFHPDLDIRNGQILILDQFTKHGVLLYSLPHFYKRLVNAFKSKDQNAILKLSADIGHYVGDAHVPLHTSMNYNGQLTNQDGIHAFWESRIPELFAEAEYNFIVGPSEYIEDINKYVKSVIKESHSYVDSVLFVEKRLSIQTPEDQQYCFESRLGQTTKLACKDYARLYSNQLDNQVEDRFRDCILSIGSIWMSAWTDAGQPNLNNLVTTSTGSEYSSQDSLNYEKSGYYLRDHE